MFVCFEIEMVGIIYLDCLLDSMAGRMIVMAVVHRNLNRRLLSRRQSLLNRLVLVDHIDLKVVLVILDLAVHIEKMAAAPMIAVVVADTNVLELQMVLQTKINRIANYSHSQRMKVHNRLTISLFMSCGNSKTQ